MSVTPISAETVLEVARLARLEVSAEEVPDLQVRLGAILKHADALADLDLDEVEPLISVGESMNCFRPDTPDKAFDPETALSLAPDQDGSFYRVPKVLGDGGGA